jgi:MYXO-CTERM domain-containing protein
MAPPSGGSTPPVSLARFAPESIDDEEAQSIPEPGSVLLAIGAAAALVRRRRAN